MQNNKDNRPLSPHLQIYAWNISSFTSIMHRATGIALYLSIVAISWYVVLFTYSQNSGEQIIAQDCDCLLREILGYAACFAAVAIVFSLYYHFCNGIRHLFWDIGKGFELAAARRSGILVIFAAFIFTFLTIAAIAYFKFM